MIAEVFDQRVCTLGEGPLWHPSRGQLFWFDILGKKLLTQSASGPQEWAFDEHVSAAGWIDDETLLIASETGLMRFSLATGENSLVVPLEENNEITRSNDGRADPWGGFWIGTMGKNAEPQAGGIYRFFNGELRKLVHDVTISNSICFAPDHSVAYFTDTPTHKIMKIALSPEDGWPSGDAQTFIDLTAEKLIPDGSVVDNEGYLWNAQWGAGRVARYGPDGSLISAHNVHASQTTCPAFGGENLKTVYVTSASDGLDGSQDGKTFCFETSVAGQAEHRVIL
jgi:sugar lactone lactonase YvrE